MLVYRCVIHVNEYTNTKHHGHIAAQRSTQNKIFLPQCGSHSYFPNKMGDLVYITLLLFEANTSNQPPTQPIHTMVFCNCQEPETGS